MGKRNRILISILLILAIANYGRITAHEDIRTVDFLSILVMGALAGVLLADVMGYLRKK